MNIYFLLGGRLSVQGPPRLPRAGFNLLQETVRKGSGARPVRRDRHRVASGDVVRIRSLTPVRLFRVNFPFRALT